MGEKDKYQALKWKKSYFTKHHLPQISTKFFLKFLMAFPVTKELQLSLGYWGDVGGRRRKSTKATAREKVSQ